MMRLFGHSRMGAVYAGPIMGEAPRRDVGLLRAGNAEKTARPGRKARLYCAPVPRTAIAAKWRPSSRCSRR